VYFLRIGIAFAVVIGLTIGQSGDQPGFKKGADPGADPVKPCNDLADNCKKPVKFVKEENGCSVFACEHGTNKEHLIRVSDQTGITKLQTIIKMEQ
jgi:hypothetical protein